MSRNLYGILANGIALKAAATVNVIVIILAISFDYTWLWLLSVAGSLVVIALSRATGPVHHTYGLQVRQPFVLTTAPAVPGSDPAGVDTYAGQRPGSARMPRGSQCRCSPHGRRRTHGSQIVLLETPPICLN